MEKLEKSELEQSNEAQFLSKLVIHGSFNEKKRSKGGGSAFNSLLKRAYRKSMTRNEKVTLRGSDKTQMLSPQNQSTKFFQQLSLKFYKKESRKPQPSIEIPKKKKQQVEGACGSQSRKKKSKYGYNPRLWSTKKEILAKLSPKLSKPRRSDHALVPGRILLFSQKINKTKNLSKQISSPRRWPLGRKSLQVLAGKGSPRNIKDN